MCALLLLSCLAVAAAGPLWASPLPRRCGGSDCGLSASPSVHHSSPTLPPTPELAPLNHRSDNTFSALGSGTTDAAEMLRGPHYGKRDGSKRSKVTADPSSVTTRGLFHGDTSAASHHQTPSASDVFSGHHLSDKFYFSGQDVQKLGAKYATDEATTMSYVYSQSSSHERSVSKDMLLNKLYTGVTLNRRHTPERLGYRTSPKQKKEIPAHVGNIFTHMSSNSYNRQSSGVSRSRYWEDYNSLVKGGTMTMKSVRDDVTSLRHSAANTEELADNELPHTSARKSGLTLPTASPPQAYLISADGLQLRDYRLSGTPDKRGRLDQGVRAFEKSEDIGTDSVTHPSTIVDEDATSDVDTGVIGTPDSDLKEQEEEIKDAIARDATLIIVFSCLAVASLVMWRIVRYIAMHKLKQHEKRLAAQKASTV